MKKIISLLLLAVMAVSLCSLAGCSGKNENELVMATNAAFPPYEYVENGEIVGIDAEIAKLIANELGMTLRIEDIDFNSIVTGVQTGKYDMGMAGLTIEPDRLESVDFTDTYATGVQVIIVKEDSPIATVDDLGAEGATYKIGVQLCTTGDIYATDDYGSERVVSYKTGADAVAALVAGKVDCVIIDNEPAKSFIKVNEGLKILDTEYALEDYAICVGKENGELLEKINIALQKLIADGTVKSIVDKYIPAE